MSMMKRPSISPCFYCLTRLRLTDHPDHFAAGLVEVGQVEAAVEGFDLKAAQPQHVVNLPAMAVAELVVTVHPTADDTVTVQLFDHHAHTDDLVVAVILALLVEDVSCVGLRVGDVREVPRNVTLLECHVRVWDEYVEKQRPAGLEVMVDPSERAELVFDGQQSQKAPERYGLSLIHI